MSSDSKRQALREKIEAGRQHLAERNYAQSAMNIAEAASGVARKHPYAALAGAIVAGLALGAMTRRGRKLSKRSGVIAGILTDAAIAYGLQMIDHATEKARNAHHNPRGRHKNLLDDDIPETASATEK